MRVRISPSLLAADFARLADEIADAESAGADMLHLDLMDGTFVPNLTFGPPVVAAMAKVATVPLDAHLMVIDPDPFIPELADAGVARVAVHIESCPHLHRTIATIRTAGMEPGIAINPATSLALLDDVLDDLAFVLVMSVNPGFGGQTFIPSSLGKIRRLRQVLCERPMDISVDGGVDPVTAPNLVASGATTLIAGSAIFRSPDRAAALAAVRDAAQQGIDP